MKSVIFWGFVSTVLCFGLSWGQTKDNQEVQRRIFGLIQNREKNDPRIRPAANITGPVIVTTNMLVRSITKIDDVNQEYNVQLTFRNTWVDERLAYPGDVKYINLNSDEMIWTPDVFFSNEMDGHAHNLLHPNILIRIYPNGQVLYSIRVSLRLSCAMNFKRYPHDAQVCSIIIPSYGHTTDDLVLVWKSGDPIQVTRNLRLSGFKLTNFYSGYCTSKTVTGEYSCLKADFRFRRSCQSFLIRVYIPSIMIVLVSYLHLWMNVTAISGRILVALGSLMLMTVGCMDLSHSLPETSYTKAIDVWTGVCLTFLFWSLVEFVVVHYLTRRSSAEGVQSSNGEVMPLEKKLQSKRLLGFLSNLPLPDRIDVITRVAYPSLFFLFNLIYWATYLPQESVEDNGTVY